MGNVSYDGCLTMMVVGSIEWLLIQSISSLALTQVVSPLTNAVSGKRYVLMSMQFMRFMAVYGWETLLLS